MSIFKFVRVSLLVIILLNVIVSTYVTMPKISDWSDPVWIYIYPIAGDNNDATASYIKNLDEEHFVSIERFIESEANRHGREIGQPIFLQVSEPSYEHPPRLPYDPNPLNIAWWSLRMRVWAWMTERSYDRAKPDVQLFVIYHDPSREQMLERSVGVQKGSVGIVHAFGSRRMKGQNQVVITHELLHTLGATDKYEPGTNQPLYPDGLANPKRKPLYPQTKAEIMAGRVPLSPTDAVMPKSLQDVVIGVQTAIEIGMYR
jgi:hypothetical protein